MRISLYRPEKLKSFKLYLKNYNHAKVSMASAKNKAHSPSHLSVFMFRILKIFDKSIEK